jgi:hypothetical protein
MCDRYLHHCLFIHGNDPARWCAGCHAEYDHYAHARSSQPLSLILAQLEREIRARFTARPARLPIEPSAN